MKAVIATAALYGLAATPALAHDGHSLSSAAYSVTDQHSANAHADRPGAESQADVAGDFSGSGKATAVKCCGVSCMSAVPQHTPQLTIVELARLTTLPPLQPELSGRGPERLDRPPTA